MLVLKEIVACQFDGSPELPLANFAFKGRRLFFFLYTRVTYETEAKSS